MQSERRTRKERSLSEQHVFMAKSLAHQKNVEQKDVFERIVSDDESTSEEKFDYEKELAVIVDYLNKGQRKERRLLKC